MWRGALRWRLIIRHVKRGALRRLILHWQSSTQNHHTYPRRGRIPQLDQCVTPAPFVEQVVAARAYLRTNTGNHKVIGPAFAPAYYGPAPAGNLSLRYSSVLLHCLYLQRAASLHASVRAGSQITLHARDARAQAVEHLNPSSRALDPKTPTNYARRYGYEGAADLFNLTPYWRYPDIYVFDKEQKQSADLWRAAIYPSAIPVNHYKWQASVYQRCAMCSGLGFCIICSHPYCLGA